MQTIGISLHLLLSTQIVGSLVWIHSISALSSWTSSCLWHLIVFLCARCSTYHWVTWWPYCTFQTIQTCSAEGHKGTNLVFHCYISYIHYCWLYNLFSAFCGHCNEHLCFATFCRIETFCGSSCLQFMKKLLNTFSCWAIFWLKTKILGLWWKPWK